MREKPSSKSTSEMLADILARVQVKASSSRNPSTSSAPRAPRAAPKVEASASEERPSGHYDFDLAEFPLFRFYKNDLTRGDREPLQYTDAITGRDGQKIARHWAVYPGPFGFGGQSTQLLLYDLLQLYVEQGCRGSQIEFGTIRALFLRRGNRNPSKRDYKRVRRDLDILLGYYFQCKNAFWDRERQAYVDMRWRLFTAAFFFKDRPTSDSLELPYGFVEVSPVLQQIARTRGFFSLGVERDRFYDLTPLEQRLATYLAKKFLSQKVHRRFVDELARALPIEASRPDNVRTYLGQVVRGLLEKNVGILESFRWEKSRHGRWLAVFCRKPGLRQRYTIPSAVRGSLAPGVAATVNRIVEELGNADDIAWWTQCAKRLGEGAVERALGQLKDAKQRGHIRKPGALLTKILKDIASEQGIALH